MRFEMPPPRYFPICLGAAEKGHRRKIVGTWTCWEFNSAWQLDPRPGGYYLVRNQLAEEKGWRDNCLTREKAAMYLGRCAEGDAVKWKFEYL
ncbi:hypothetical protein FCH28_08940 [Streptomyces piniterrae]|uniref:Ricin B lectin domain-containing protein n=1 Tax=Streptomyces piniterrae TaxID=2571125 RepID=A0A4U0NM58_9ACTN|nr:hypothetical protein [Streptomyces piniterrae]TJZ55475.1 hypothetical protein FCH28_08940 [Streptomyces piniterrae]